VIAHPKVGEKLGVMSGEQDGDGFDFQIDCIFRHDAGAKALWNRRTLADDGHSDPSFKADAGMARLEGQPIGIHRCQQAWTNRTMDLDAEPDDIFHEDSLVEHKQLRDALWFSAFSVVEISEG
jgi:hypothetical protein